MASGCIFPVSNTQRWYPSSTAVCVLGKVLQFSNSHANHSTTRHNYRVCYICPCPDFVLPPNLPPPMSHRLIMTNRFFFTLLLLASFSTLYGQKPVIQRADPTNWWVGMKKPELQILLYGKDLKGSMVRIDHPGVSIRQVHEVENPNYLFIDLHIAPDTKPGRIGIALSKEVKVEKAGKLVT